MQLPPTMRENNTQALHSQLRASFQDLVAWRPLQAAAARLQGRVVRVRIGQTIRPSHRIYDYRHASHTELLGHFDPRMFILLSGFGNRELATWLEQRAMNMVQPAGFEAANHQTAGNANWHGQQFSAFCIYAMVDFCGTVE